MLHENNGDTEVYHRGLHMHGHLANSTLLCNCSNHSNIQVFNKFFLAHVGPAVRGLDRLFDPFCMWGNEMSMNISQVKKLNKIARIKKLATKNNKIFVCTMKKISVNYRMVLTLILPPVLFSLHISFVRSQSISTLTKVIEKSINIQTANSLFLDAL